MNNSKKKNKKNTVVGKEDFWKNEREANKPFPVYPELEPISFKRFIMKILTGLTFSLLPSLCVSLINPEANFLYVWGVASVIVGGLYLIFGSVRDYSEISARKSHKRYMERVELTKEKESFKFNLGFLTVGTAIEDFGAGFCVAVIGFFIFSLI